MSLPPRFQGWFETRGWQPHPHQLALLARASATSTLLIAPTGGGKTLAGFLPTLVDLAANPRPGMHTLYISPLKALAADIRRNLETPVAELGLNVRVEDRTGDTAYSQRRRQRTDPPHILLTTPESLALLLSYEDAPRIFAGLSRVVIDEIHALAESKRGDQLMLCLSRLQSLAPGLARTGLSATVDDPPALAEYLAPGITEIVHAAPGPKPDIRLLDTDDAPPWAGHGGRFAARAVMEEIRKAGTTLVFINTRATAELFFQELWSHNEENLPIALHHGSLSREARTRVEHAMVAGELRAIVCTASLDLGIDWGDVDLVIQVGAPRNVKRLVQRIGRAGHRYNTPSRALLVPANRFEVIECRAALEAVMEGDLDRTVQAEGPLDVLCQHILLMACSAPFTADELYEEIVTAGPYRALLRAEFEEALEFCATGGYALRAYDRWQRLVQREGRWQLRDPRTARALRMNIGTIIGTETLSVRLRGRGAPLGEVEESFAASLVPGDTFLIGGQTVRYEGLREMTIEVSKQPSRQPKIAVFGGLRMSTSLELSRRVIDILNTPARWADLPAHTADWLNLQRDISALPAPGGLLSEAFLRGDRAFLSLYSFAGRNANQTLGLLLTRRMEDLGLNPTGFVANDYAVLVWGLTLVKDVRPLLSPDGLRDGLESWLAENAVMKRTFRASAIIAGLIERNQPGRRKTGRQATFSSDILYDTLRKYDPDHLMLKITKEEASRGLVDFDRIEEMLSRAPESRHIVAPHVTPFAAPLLLELGKVPIQGSAQDVALQEEADRMMQEAGLA
ncbi:ligase-associated DNA damage response DEXH box helicase [Algicella marina]|uniref:Ligase-associated DNA damage response DEXH box helicase n=1 Tax=Algicella marina TaxID=2683284 RepID=A0A6P1T6A4_9RHOB|nr:ligase-associated DNA damage response DEXH box helicase [Algicella marina]QHQ37220.1 ligase-associated DNA damage response DEXH box helicase [Algicella marina]